jgi:hypothetical protein
MAAAAADSINQSSSTSTPESQGKLQSSALENSGNFSLGTQKFSESITEWISQACKIHFKNFIIFITNLHGPPTLNM